MTDIVERLRLHRSWRDSHGELNEAPLEAATALEALRAENVGLARVAGRDALELMHTRRKVANQKDEIERLRAERDALREALNLASFQLDIACKAHVCPGCGKAALNARKALGE